MPYRLEIDGLRAIAVLLVCAFHLNIPSITGGFAGVDIFFVISGFVIFRSALDNIERNQFSIRQFYLRRIRRIIPALISVILFCLIVGSFLLNPKPYLDMSESGLAAIFSISNIYFFDRSDYFAPSAINHPLLHTWSLGVEEQFYIIFPLLYFISKIKAGTPIFGRLILAVIILSFSYNLIAIYNVIDSNQIFYLPMSRLWEIGTGALIARAERTPHPLLQHLLSRHAGLLSTIGLGGIILSAFVIDTSMPFPGIAAILPVASSALLILSEPIRSKLSYKFLTMPPMIFFGRISYSLYLYHWPIIVFFTLYAGRGLTTPEKILVFACSVGLAKLAFEFIEQPFRIGSMKIKSPLNSKYISLCVSVTTLLCILVIIQGGFPQRLNSKALIALQDSEAQLTAIPKCLPVFDYNAPPNTHLCSETNPWKGPIDYIVFGDSHSGKTYFGLHDKLNTLGKNGLRIHFDDCSGFLGVYTIKAKRPSDCAASSNFLIDLVSKEKVPVVVLSNRWALLGSQMASPEEGLLPKKLMDVDGFGAPISFENALKRTVHRLLETGTYVVVVGPVPEAEFRVPEMLVRANQWGRPMPQIPRDMFKRRQSVVLPALKSIETMKNISVIYPHHVLCDEKQCYVTKDDRTLYDDANHLSVLGYRLIAPQIAEAVLKTESGNTN